MVVEVKPIAGPFTLGEGPHWDEKSKTLFFVDIDGKLLCKYNPANDTVTKCSLDAKPGFVLPIEGKKDQYLLGYGGDFALVSWDGQSGKPQEIKILTKGDPHPENRINDGKADPTGRVYAEYSAAADSDIMKKIVRNPFNVNVGTHRDTE